MTKSELLDDVATEASLATAHSVGVGGDTDVGNDSGHVTTVTIKPLPALPY